MRRAVGAVPERAPEPLAAVRRAVPRRESGASHAVNNMSTIQIHNTLTRRKEVFTPHVAGGSINDWWRAVATGLFSQLG